MVSARWSDGALENVGELDSTIRERVLAKVSWLEKNFAHVVHEGLHHEFGSSYKLRVGDYRAIYSVGQDLITIEKVGHRRDIYK